MTNLDKWFERVYSETDFGRSIATSIAGAVGLIVYLSLGDWVISVFAAIISFPIARLLATWLYEKARRASNRRLESEQAKYTYDCLSNEEKQVVQAFVEAGGSVLTWSQVNSLSLSESAIESLIQRGLLEPSATADSMRETFVLYPDIFDAGLSKSKHTKIL
ncbi:MAG: superinfection exclusion B family protein [Synechococcales cyanobacterium K44_A2020_017]|nr:superinfection exclusion B family protein [Synechococcales cyanobacterium K32_A2020_035]MBF2094875.1 superinfection exclusion B family protein [Synechococcales cyanobacterium K44_A2020_017]